MPKERPYEVVNCDVYGADRGCWAYCVQVYAETPKHAAEKAAMKFGTKAIKKVLVRARADTKTCAYSIALTLIQIKQTNTHIYTAFEIHPENETKETQDYL